MAPAPTLAASTSSHPSACEHSVSTETETGAVVEPTDASSPFEARMRLRIGETDLLFEGSEAFLRELLPLALARLVPGANPPAAPPPSGSPASVVSGPLSAFADELEVTPVQLQAALRPEPTPPYLSVNPHHWAHFKERSPRTGRSASNDVQFVAMALSLWFRHLDRSPPTLADVRLAVRQSQLTTKNATRSIENGPALQRQGETVSVRPTEFLLARNVVRILCLPDAGLAG